MGDGDDEDEAGEEECEASDDGADTAAGKHAEITAQLGCLRTRERLICSEDSIESLDTYPPFLNYQFLFYHGYLGDRATEGLETE